MRTHYEFSRINKGKIQTNILNSSKTEVSKKKQINNNSDFYFIKYQTTMHPSKEGFYKPISRTFKLDNEII